jgi:predicted transcriptional regulator
MKDWQKITLDPGHFTALRMLSKPKTKDELAEEAGFREARCQKILKNLREKDLASSDIENGVRKFERGNISEKKDEVKEELLSSTMGGVRELVNEEKFSEARSHLTTELPVEGEVREKVSKLELAEKLVGIC